MIEQPFMIEITIVRTVLSAALTHSATIGDDVCRRRGSSEHHFQSVCRGMVNSRARSEFKYPPTPTADHRKWRLCKRGHEGHNHSSHNNAQKLPQTKHFRSKTPDASLPKLISMLVSDWLSKGEEWALLFNFLHNPSFAIDP